VRHAIEVMPHLVRQQDQRQREREGNSQPQMPTLERPLDRKYPVFNRERRKSLQKIPFQPRSDNQRREERRNEKQNVEPISPLWPSYVNYVRRLRSVDLAGNINLRRILAGHGRLERTEQD